MTSDAETAAARFQWDDGLRRLEALAGDGAGPARERVAAACADELRRRLGMTFSTRDLAALYPAAADWFLPLAVELAPAHPQAWEPSVVLDAAFARFRMQAGDAHGGG